MGIAWLLLMAGSAEGAVVTAQPEPALPGQTVNFAAPANFKIVRAAGGGFGAGREVKPGEPLTDSPHVTTAYRFDVRPSGSVKEGKAASQRVTVQVLEGKFPPLATYHDTRSWRIDLVAGWNRYVTPQVDPANNALIYFQLAEDSVERLAVALVPVKGNSCEDLMRQVLNDAPTQYDVLEEVSGKATTHLGMEARWAQFKGLDRALPGIPTKSMVLVFLKPGTIPGSPRFRLGCVVSARTRESQFEEKLPLMRALVRSFAFEVPQPAPQFGSNRASAKAATGTPSRQ